MMTGWAALNAADARHPLESNVAISGLSLEVLRAKKKPFASELH
jgi:histidine ammonia-lyase